MILTARPCPGSRRTPRRPPAGDQRLRCSQTALSAERFSTGWLLAVAPGKSDRGLRHCLAAHGLGARFISLQTADGHPSKPHPAMALAAMTESGAEPRHSVVIGDIAWDMGMARAAGAGAIGALWGYHDENELLAGGALALAASPGEVAAVAARLIGDGVHG